MPAQNYAQDPSYTCEGGASAARSAGSSPRVRGTLILAQAHPLAVPLHTGKSLSFVYDIADLKGQQFAFSVFPAPPAQLPR